MFYQRKFTIKSSRILKEPVPYAEFETASHITSEVMCKRIAKQGIFQAL